MIETAVGIEQVDGVPVRISRKAGKPLMLLTRMASQGTGIWDAVWDRLAEDFTVANFDLIASAKRSSWPVIITMSALACATSAPCPMAIETCAAASTGASLTPSPTIATISPRACNSRKRSSLP